MKRLRLLLGIVAALLVLALAGLWFLTNPNRYRGIIQTRLEAQLGRKVTLGTMSLGLFPLRFQVENPVIGEDPAVSTTQPFIRAEKLDVEVGLFPLLRGDVQVHSLELRGPGVELIRGKQGTWNFATLGKTRQDASSSAPNGASDAGSGGALSLDKLTIVDGEIGITDLQQNRPRAAYEQINLTVLDYASGKPFSFDLNTKGIQVKGEAGPVVAANATEIPFRGKLNFNQVNIHNFAPDAEGSLSGESDIASQAGAIMASGKLNIEKMQWNKVDIGYPIQLDYKLGAGIADGLVSIDNAILKLGETPLALSGTVQSAKTPAVVDLRIKSGDTSIAEIARLASAFGVAFSPGTTVTGRVSADLAAQGPVTKPVLTGTIAGRDLHVSGQGIAQPVDVKSIQIALTPTAIQSNEFNATSGKTTVAGRFAVKQYASDSPSLDVALRSPGATLPEIQSIARAYGITGLDQLVGTGSLNFDLRANGPLKSLDATAATRALNGVVNLDFSPLKILGFDTLYELGKLGGFGSSQPQQNATDIIKMVGRVVVKDGVAETNDLKAEIGSGNLAATGTADLATETLNLKLAAIFSKAFKDKAGGSKIGGMVSSAFSNSAGELVLPVLVKGTFKNPQFSPDVKAIAELQKQKIAPALNKVLGEQKSGAIQGILDALRGKKK